MFFSIFSDSSMTNAHTHNDSSNHPTPTQ